MDYKYEEALERAKELHKAGNALTKLQMEIVFPALKESEDERIRKYIVSFVELNKGVNLPPDDADNMLAYLERQKEQKSIEDVVKDITKNKEAATKFLKSAGVMDENGELAEMYRSEKPAEWSENDRKMLEAICSIIRMGVPVQSSAKEKIDWLKSLRPQPHWKPSKEDLTALEYCAEHTCPELLSLYLDLKKLL